MSERDEGGRGVGGAAAHGTAVQGKLVVRLRGVGNWITAVGWLLNSLKPSTIFIQ